MMYRIVHLLVLVEFVNIFKFEFDTVIKPCMYCMKIVNKICIYNINKKY